MGPEPLDIDSALEIVLAGAPALETEELPLTDAPGRHLARPAIAATDLPGFDNSVMDGYALRSGDVAGASAENPVTLEIAGESRAGSPCEITAGTGQAIRVSTGAMLPDGTDTVVRQEVVDLDGAQVTVTAAPVPGSDIRRQGEVLSAGTEVLAAGARLGAVEIGILAASGADRATCHRRPRVSLLTSGDELVEPGSPLAEGQIWNSNRPAISALISDSGAELIEEVTVPDRHEDTVNALKSSLDADLTVICGGVSVGEHDHVKPALAELGVEQRFWGLALKPGKPAWFGERDGSKVLGLPGNPVSALVVFSLLGRPLIDSMAGNRRAARRPVMKLASGIDRLPARLHAVPCRPSESSRAGDLEPIPQIGSHDLISLRGATALALIPPGQDRAEAGEEVETLPLVSG